MTQGPQPEARRRESSGCGGNKRENDFWKFTVAAWRCHAIELFPSLQNELNDPEYTIYMLYFDLLPMTLEAHEKNDCDRLRRIYGFAAWCVNQTTGELMNAAGVAFYEHLFDEKRYWGKVVPWLSPHVIRECWPLWEFRLEKTDLAEIEKLVKSCKELRYHEIF